MVDEQQDDPPGQEEEDELGERVGRARRSGGIRERRTDEERERPHDEVPGVQTDPFRVHHVDGEEPEEDRRVGKRHDPGALPASTAGRRSYN
jgi:hypothetical protein